MAQVLQIPNLTFRRPQPYPRKPPYPTTCVKVRPVTIAIGFRCTDGVVLAADTEYNVGNSKVHATKIFELQPRQDFRVVFTGAGDASYMKMAVEKIDQAMPTGNQTILEIKDTIEKINAQIHKKHIYPFPGKAAEKPFYQLLAAIWTKGQRTRLIKTSETSLSEVPEYECLGYGDLANYLASVHYSSTITTQEAMLLAVYSVSLSKKHVPSCSGNTNVAIVTNDGQIDRPLDSQISAAEIYFKEFEQSIADLMVTCLSADSTEEEIDNIIEMLRDTVKAERKRYVRKEQIRRQVIDVVRKSKMKSS